MYVVVRCSDCKFLSSIDIDYSISKFTSRFDKAILYDSQYQAEKFGSYCVDKVAVLKVCCVI